MYGNANDAYLESRVLTADPLGLVRLLYQGAATAIREARAHLDTGDIAARSQALNKACALLGELTASLNHEQGGEISGRLQNLYEYMQWKLVEANAQQSAEPMLEVLNLLATMEDGWAAIQAGEAAQASAPAPAEPAAQMDNPFAATPWSDQPAASAPASSTDGGYGSWAPGQASYGAWTPEPAPAYNSWNPPLAAEPEPAETHAWSF